MLYCRGGTQQMALECTHCFWTFEIRFSVYICCTKKKTENILANRFEMLLHCPDITPFTIHVNCISIGVIEALNAQINCHNAPSNESETILLGYD